MRRLSKGYIEDYIKSQGYTSLSMDYKGACSKISIMCPNNHTSIMSWHKFNSGRRCKFCNGHRLYFLDIVKDIEKENYVLLSKEYVNKEVLELICPKGHRFNILYSNWKRGSRCKKCFIKGRTYSFDEFKLELKKEGYSILSLKTAYTNSKSKLLCICPNGHNFYTSRSAFKNGNRCPKCSLEKVKADLKLSYLYIKNSFNANGYTLDSTTYKNAFDKLQYTCPKGHIGSIRWNDWQQGCRCAICSFSGHRSLGEKSVANFLTNIGLDIVSTDRTLIAPYEIDILIPDKKLAIEYCGLYWHSELAGKDKHYHINKLKACEEKGYRLITIFEDEWLNKREIVENTLKIAVNYPCMDYVSTNDCYIAPIDYEVRKVFLINNDLIGDSNSDISIGLFHADLLLSVLSFSMLLPNELNPTYTNIWRLDRFSIKNGYIIDKVTDKMLNYFCTNYNWDLIIVYVDRRWGTVGEYCSLGFEVNAISNAGCWYSKDGCTRLNKIDIIRTLSKIKNSEEYDYYKIWDCGNYKLTKRKDILKYE